VESGAGGSAAGKKRVSTAIDFVRIVNPRTRTISL